MKNVMKSAALTILVCSATLSYAAAPVQAFKESLIKSDTASAEQPRVIVKNNKGNTIFIIEDTTAESVTEKIRYIDLPDGTYTFEFVAESELEIVPFLVENGTIRLDSINARTIYKPTLRVKGDLVLVNQLTLQQKPLKITMYYSAEAEKSRGFYLIHSEKIKAKTIIQRAYGLDRNKTGTYKVELVSDGKVFVETFEF